MKKSSQVYTRIYHRCTGLSITLETSNHTIIQCDDVSIAIPTLSLLNCPPRVTIAGSVTPQEYPEALWQEGPHTVHIEGANEYGARSTMKIVGIEFVEQVSSGHISFIAAAIFPWAPAE